MKFAQSSWKSISTVNLRRRITSRSMRICSTCVDCSAEFCTLTAEQEMFARYDREIEVPPFLWTRIAAHICFGEQAHTKLDHERCRSVCGDRFRGAVRSGCCNLAFAIELSTSEFRKFEIPKDSGDHQHLTNQFLQDLNKSNGPSRVNQNVKPDLIVSKPKPKSQS